MELLPQSYVINQIYAYCKRPLYKKNQGTYNAECPVCGEGSSKGRKRRLFYFPKEHYLYCFNCARSWKEATWIQEVGNKSYLDIVREAAQYDTINIEVSASKTFDPVELEPESPPIPPDAVNICDKAQMAYYESEPKKHALLKKAFEYCRKRRLFTAVNKIPAFYFSFDDKIHKNRLIIPFYSSSSKIEYYQSRTLNGDEYPKYLCKLGDKCLFGEAATDVSIPFLFLFEGPVDAMFVRNGLGMASTSLTEKQSEFVQKCIGMEPIYVFDNDVDNAEVKAKIIKTIKEGNRVFIWPAPFRKYKDVNQICSSLKLDEFPWKFIVENSFTGVKALMKL